MIKTYMKTLLENGSQRDAGLGDTINPLEGR